MNERIADALAVADAALTSRDTRIAELEARVAEGKTNKGAIRVLKRQISNAVYRQLVLDAARARR